MDIQQLETYLQINTEKYHEPNLETLNHYLERYMLTVPFENIDVQNQKPISIAIDDLYHKIVENKRGGFCYEMNWFFQHYLQEKGFDAHLVSATIHTPGGGRSQPGSHMSTLVYLDQPYIADVGFGDLPLRAIPLGDKDTAEVIEDVNGYYRAIQLNEEIFHVQKWTDGDWRTSYEATLIFRNIEDFHGPMEYNQHNENSIFVKKLVVTLPKVDGRATMSENDVTITKNGEKSKIPVTKNNYRKLLQEHFGLEVEISRLENLADSK